MAPRQARLERAYEFAGHLVQQEGTTIREAVSRTLFEKRTRVDRSILNRRVQRSRASNHVTTRQINRPTALSYDQEKEIAEACRFYSIRGIPLVRTEIAELVQAAYGHLPSIRASFKNGKPGRYWMRGFCHRHHLSFNKPSHQAAERFRATNAEVLTSHLTKLEYLLQKFRVDATRVFNLDETGMTFGNDCQGKTRRQIIVPRATSCHAKGPDFAANINRVSLMACISAAGESVLPLWIFKGKRLPYRVRTLPNGQETHDSAAGLLPPNSLLATRPDVGGMDSTIFVAWCKKFVERVAHLTKDGRKVLLIYDALRAYMSLTCLEVLRKVNVEAYTIPAHTSGATQPLDVGVYSSFKRAINEQLNALSVCMSTTVALYDTCAALNSAYNSSFTRENIMKGFAKTSVWPYNLSVLLNRPLPRNKEEIDSIVDIVALKQLLEEKRRARFNRNEINVFLSRKGSIDTQHGSLLTSDEAMNMAREKERKPREKKLLEDLKHAKRDILRQKIIDARKDMRLGTLTYIRKERARRLGVTSSMIPNQRSLALRCAVARANTIQRKFRAVRKVFA